MQSLDDVDFTVLAATSVLGDLIDNCPPAEACRDAFDRMSKATIQMCMSTTGFGAQALRALPQTQRYHAQTSPTGAYTSSASDADARSDTEMQGYGTGNTANFFGQQQQQQQQQHRRPVPRFDMNLKDLFSDDETDKRSFSRVSNQVNAMRPPPTPMKSENQPQLQQPFTADLKISPQLRSHQQTNYFAAAASPNMTSPNNPSTFSAGSTAAATPTSPYQITNSQVPYNNSNFAQNLNSSYPDLGGFSDLDFLDSFPMQGGSGAANGGAEAAAGGLQDVGIGFGMGFGDGTHDWSDGNGLDLFDGFFFGKFLPRLPPHPLPHAPAVIPLFGRIKRERGCVMRDYMYTLY